MTKGFKKVSFSIVGGLLAMSVLAGCGGDSTEAYCGDLKKANSDFSAMSEGDIGQFDQVIERMHKISESAPDDVKDDWKTLDTQLQKLKSELSDAGIKFKDLEGIQEGKMPKGLDPSKLQELSKNMQGLSSDKVQKASENISKHAKEECDIDLGS